MKITRIYAGQDGMSHFEDVEVPFKDFEAADRRSKKLKRPESSSGKRAPPMTLTTITLRSGNTSLRWTVMWI